MRLNYRPEIDGLRGIAVVAVILYHAQITIFGHNFFEGGFIGVDIFFVISGYLITSLILKELETTGKFSFLYFYERRARRILPVLFVVMLASLPLAWMYLTPTLFVDSSKSILYSLGFSSNFHFWFTGQLYGAADGMLKPFLHTWSLSVEEQYYVIFPICLIICFKYFRRYLVHLIFFSILVSLIAAEWGSRHYPSFNFYVLHSRGWELLAGSLLAKLEINKGRRSSSSLLNQILPSLGLVLIVHAIVLYNDEMFHPSFYTLSPIIGVSLIIWFSHKNELITKILSSKLFVGTGLISYSLYLWHYSIFVFARIALVDPTIYKKILLGMLIITLSILSYFIIEKPYRNKKIINKKFLSISIILSLVLLIALNSFVIFKDGKMNKKVIEFEKATASPLYDDGKCKFSTEESNFLKNDKFTVRFNKCLKDNNKPFILVIGDSHGVDIFNSISTLSSYDFIIGLNRGGCRPGDENKCQYKDALKFVEKNKENIRVIFLHNKGSYMLTHTGERKSLSDPRLRKMPLDDNQIANTINYAKDLKNIFENVILIGPHIEPNISIYLNTLKKLNKNYLKNNANFDIINVDNELKKLTKKNKIFYISKIDLINYDFEKDFYMDDKFNFSDYDHWSKHGEIYFGKKLFSHPDLKEYLQ